MPILFTLHLSTHRGGMVKGPVRAVQPGILVTPDKSAVRECLPHYYRKAFDRASHFWQDKNNFDAPHHCALYGSRGRYLNTIYAQPYDFAP